MTLRQTRKESPRVARKTPARSEIGKNLLVLLGTVLVALALGEVVARLSVPFVRGSHQHPGTITRDELEGKPHLMEYDSLLGWRFAPNRTVSHQGWEFKVPITTNSLGFRDGEHAFERKDGRRRVLLLGDSFGMGYGVEQEYSFASVLQDAGTEVINLSVSAYGTDQELLLYQTLGKRYDVDAVLLALTIGNDLADITGHHSIIFNKPWFELEDGRLSLKGVPPPPPATAAPPVEENGRPPAGFRCHDFLDAHSALYALLFERLSWIPSVRRAWEASGLIVAPIDLFYGGELAPLDTSPPPKVDAAWQLMFALLDQWGSEVRENGARPVVLLIPMQLQVDPAVLRRITARMHFPPGRLDPDLPDTRLSGFCRAHGMAVIDLLPPFREEARKGAALYFNKDPHWNRFGHRLAAKVIARSLPALLTPPAAARRP
jgi:hypothetical protein